MLVSENLHRLAQRLSPTGRCFMAILGDSTSAQNTGSSTQGRWARGFIERWPVDWAQYVGWDFATSDREGNSSIYLPGTGIAAGATLLDGSTTNPFCLSVVDQAQSSAGSHDVTYGRVLLNSLANYLGGDWTIGHSMLVRRLWTRGTGGNLAGCTQINANLAAGGSDGPGITTHNATLYGAAGARAAYDQTFTRGSGACINLQIDILNHGAVSGTACNYKTIWRLQDSATGKGLTRGFGFAAIAQGGWGTRDHIDNYSTAALTWEIEQCSINTLVIQIGINVESGESSSNLPTATFSANLRELVAKAHAAFDAANSGAGVPDKLVVVMSPWSGGTGGYYVAMSAAQAAVAREFKNTVFVSCEAMLQRSRGTTWYSSPGSGAPVLADGVHQSVAGALELADLLWSESKRALAANENKQRRRRLAA